MSKKNVQEILPLSPVQQGMLFHTLYEPTSTAYIEQYAFAVGAIDPDAFTRCMQQLADRHVVLRTAFVWKNLRNPVQVIHKPGTVTIPVHREDWTTLEADERQRRRVAFQRAERVRGFELTKVPAIRIALLQLEPDQWWAVWTYSHLILDGWSVGLMSREIQELMRADATGDTPKLPKPRPFSDFIRWYKRQDLDAARAYWTEALAGIDEPTPLGIDRPESGDDEVAGERFNNINRRIPPTIGTAAIQFSRRQRVTMPTLIQAAWALVLSRYSGRDDVMFGLTVSGRPHNLPGVQQMLGCFINTLPVRVPMARDTPVTDWLQSIQTSQRALRPFEHSPLVEVRGWSDVSSDRQLFDSIVVYEGFGADTAGGGSSGDKLAYRTNYALAIGAMPDAESVTFAIGADRRRITDSAAARLLDHLERAFSWIVSQPDACLGDFVLTDELTAARRAAWDTHAADYDRHRPLTALLDDTVERVGDDAIAAEYHDADGGIEQLDYRQLTDASLRLARHLRARGVGPEVRVGICVERGLDLLIATLGVLRAGGTYVPLDPAYPTDRIRHVLDDAAVGALITHEALVPHLPTLASDASLVLLDRDRDTIDALEATPLPTIADPANLAYVIYTSGSTGKPKGVQIPHRPLINFLESMARAPGFAADDTLVAVTTLAFDIAGLELYLPLLVGGRVVIADRETALDGERLARLLETSKATVMQATPATWRVLLESGWRGTPGLKVLCGGEALPRELADRLLALDLELWNLYGPTETTIWSTTTRVEKDAAAVSIGQAIANTEIHIVDQGGHAVATSVAGELLIGGDGLARGYAGRPGLTAERFVPDGFTGRSGRRVYRTGDLARWREDGNIEYIGRADQQVKIRGYRIELGEIESVAARVDGVGQVAVVVRTESANDQRLVGYWVAALDADPKPTPTSLRDAVAEALPNYMVPSTFVETDELPLTPNGKVDRGALARLPLPVTDTATGERDADALARSPAETLIADLWCEILGRETVTRGDDFFALGGHSLLATTLAARLRKVFDVEVPLRTLFEAPTVSGMAERVAAIQQAGGATAPPLVPAPTDAAKQLSFAQERLWFLDKLEPGNPWYNIPAAVRLRGPLDPERLARALSAVMARHEVLRTQFREVEGRPVAALSAPEPVDLPIVDVSDLDGDEQDNAVAQRIGAEVATTFDLEDDPLMRALLLRRAENDHVLVLTLHHIASDEWSMGVLVREVTLGYGALGDDDEATTWQPPALPIQYGDFAHWQRGWLAGDVLEGQIAYWREQLGDAPPLLELPTDHPRPQTPSYRGGTEVALLPPETAEPLRALGRKHGATTFMTALAAFAVVLGRTAGQEDVVIGTPTANRGRLELEPLIGFFVNTLALRIRFDDAPTFPALLTRARKTLLGAHASQDLPFEQLVQALDPERSLRHAPIFQVMLVMQAAQPEAPSISEVEVEGVAASADTSKFDLTLTVSDTGEGALVTRLVYATDLFTAATARRMLAHLHQFLHEVVTTPERPVNTIPLLGAEERGTLLSTWSRPRDDFETVTTLHTLVEHQVARTPDATAVIAETGTLTFAQLDREANQLARHLRAQGAGPEVVVGIALDRSPAVVVGVLAILKTGAAYVPLDPALPDDRLAFMLADTQAPLLVTSSSLADRFAGETMRMVQVDRDADAIARQPETAPDVAVDADHIAYIIFTSGSTGRPKGVAVPHGAVANRMQWVRELDVDAPPRFLQKSSLGFDVSVAEIFAPLVAGGCTVLPKPGGTQDTDYLLDLIARTEVTHTSFPPTLLEVLLDDPTFVTRAASLRSVIVGGEAVPPALPGRFYPKLPNAVLENRYGPTEATISVTTWPCPNEPDAPPEPTLPIGLPISKAEVYVVDPRSEPVPVGNPGEIVIGGGCLARGYLGRPALTADAFVPHPFSAQPGQRLYRTGDLGRWRDDGALLFAGRVDQQIKLRGFRIELGEIEATLARQPGVGANAVIVRTEATGDQRLIAFWQPEPDADGLPSADALRAAMATSLPNYMVPSAFVQVDALPMTPSGKVDRRALDGFELPETDRGEAAPLSPFEALIADLWREALGVAQVHPEDDFFALGGHSLLASVLLARLRALFEIELPLRDLFEASTLRGMASLVESAQLTDARPTTPAMTTAPADAPVALSFAQERLWFLDKLQPGNPWYNIPAAVRLRGALDPDGFVAGLTEIVARHQVLRTRFGEANGSPRAVVDPPTPFDLPQLDLSELEGDAREAAVQRHIATESAKPFDLARGPLLRALLLRCAEDEHVLILTMHHIVSDEWSAGVLVREISMAYEAHVAGRAAALPTLPIQYADFAHWQRSWLHGDVLHEQIAYWREQLADAPPLLELPTDRPRPQTASYRGGTDKALIPAEVADPLRALGRDHGATTFMTALAAFAVVLGRYAGQRDVVIGSPIANRGRVELEPLIGFFVNTLALRVRFDDNPTFSELLARARKTLLGAHAAQDLPFEQLVQALDPERSLSHAPIFQVMLVMQNAGQRQESPLATLEAESLVASAGTSKFDLTLTVADAGDGDMLARLVYATDLFTPETARRVLTHVGHFLREVARDPDRPVTTIPLSDADERERVLGTWSRPREDFEAVSTLHTLVEQQVARTPDAIAVAHDHGTVTYRQLERDANRLAHHLLALGAGPDTVIGIALDPSPDLVVGVLAILKTGAAYLPLDPTYPEDRLAFMLEDAGAARVVTTSTLAERFPDTEPRWLPIDLDAEAIAARPEARPEVAVAADHVAYIIYTSGSTGQPKGVAVPHRAVANRMQWVRAVDLDAPPRFLQKSSICFDVSVAEIFAPLVTGGCCVLPKPGGVQDTEYLLDLIARAGVTHTSFPPSLLGVLLEQPTFVTRTATLRSVVVGGEAVPPELPARFYDKLPGAVLENRYGPTEATISVTTWPCPNDEDAPVESTLPIGLPISKAEIYLVDGHGAPVAVGVPGEILLGGDCLARGYLGRAALNASAFVPHPFSDRPGARLYRTGDLGRWRHDGVLLFAGRVDQQVKIRGFRIELGEIESTLAAEPTVHEAIVIAHDVEGPVTTDRRLAAFVVGTEGGTPAEADVLRAFVRERLPYYMVPSRFEALDAMPVTSSGKVDRKALVSRLAQRPDATDATRERTPPSSALEQAIATAWQDVLQLDDVSADDSFFDLGGHSLLLTQVHARLRDDFDLDVSMMDLFQYPTIRALARHLGDDALDTAHRETGGIDPRSRAAARRRDRTSTDIAVIAMNGRFPGAPDIDALWDNLEGGVDAITFHSHETLRAAGVPESDLSHPNFVPASMVLPDIDLFDAKFFEYAPREAQVIDPQQRIFLEIAWEAFEKAGYDTSRYKDRVAVYAGVGSNTYQINLFSQPGLVQNVGMFQLGMSNEKDFLTTRVSYKLGLRGPSVNVQCACSTSLVAITLACDSLVEHRADMALAGGVTIRANSMQPTGYVFEDGGITSHDGHTRTFDANSTGTVGGSGAGVVLLKRLADAERDGDHVHAVIKGWALNNDGADKIGWTAPGVSGQVEVIREALADADVDPSTIGYVEAHGTATALGDPIEVEALNQAYDLPDADHACAIGSIKSNLGHLDTAAGVSGLIKTVLALEHQAIPPSLHVDAPNPKVPFDQGPFFVNTELRPWTSSEGTPRRAAVSALGIGGTNAHVILQEADRSAPEALTSEHPPTEQLLLLSAKTRRALERATVNLARHLESHPDTALADVAFTLQVGRQIMPFRRALVARDHDEAVALLDEPTNEGVMSAKQTALDRPVVFLFPGGGAQHRGMGHDLYVGEPTYRREIDRCADLFEAHMGFDLRTTLYAADGPDAAEADARMRRTSFALPMLFATEYALGRLLMDRGITPRAMIGHSLGEYTAAAIAGVLSLDDATRLVAARARLFESLPHGTMLSVNLPVDELTPLLGEELAIAAVNTPTLCVASGPVAAIEALAERLEDQEIENSRLHIDVAAHSPMVEPILEAFGEAAAGVATHEPTIPYVSNVTGTWLREEDHAEAEYWPRHLRSTVRFAEGLATLLAREEDVILLEVGPGKTLSTLARQHPSRPAATPVRTTMRHPREARSDTAFLRNTLGRLWLDGAHIDWEADAGLAPRRRVQLPTYPFERQRCWVDAGPMRRPSRAVAAMEEAPNDAPTWATPTSTSDTDSDTGPDADDLDAYVAPRNEAEQKLAALWEDLLGIERVGIHDDFFELGGSSLMAVRLGTRLRTHFDTELSPHFLLEAPTVARLAAQLGEATAADDAGEDSGPSSIVVPMTSRPKQDTPLFMIHPVGGHVYFYRAMAEAIGGQVPVFAIRARGLQPDETPFNNLKTMASHYVEQIRAQQPRGPYRLGGSSMGGMVAYEVAQQLVAAGEVVELLALLDTAILPNDPDKVINDASVLAYLVRSRTEGGWMKELEDFDDADLEGKLDAIIQQAQDAGALPDGLDVRKLVRLTRHHFEAMAGYTPQPYPGRLTFFRARDRKASEPRRPEAPWIELAAGGVEVHVVPGDHISMHRPPHLPFLADQLRRAIDRLGARRR